MRIELAAIAPYLSRITLRACQAEWIEASILSGYPHAAECDLFSRQVLPHIEHRPLGFN